jgi:hypothetical protein
LDLTDIYKHKTYKVMGKLILIEEGELKKMISEAVTNAVDGITKKITTRAARANRNMLFVPPVVNPFDDDDDDDDCGYSCGSSRSVGGCGSDSHYDYSYGGCGSGGGGCGSSSSYGGCGYNDSGRC